MYNFEWLASKLRTHADVGRWHARKDYPGEHDFVEVELYATANNLFAEEAGLEATPAVATGGSITAFRPR